MIDISQLSAAELDELIEAIAKRRADVQPVVASEPPEGRQVVLVQDPKWIAMLQGTATILSFRHVSLGWVHFEIPAHERATIATTLLRQALVAPQADGDQAAAAAATAARGGSSLH